MSEHVSYLCDIGRNGSCRKTGCVINGGECYCTTDPLMAMKDGKGRPVVCPPGRKFDIAILDEQDRRHAMSLVYSIRRAQEEDAFEDHTVRMSREVADRIVELLGRYVLGVKE